MTVANDAMASPLPCSNNDPDDCRDDETCGEDCDTRPEPPPPFGTCAGPREADPPGADADLLHGRPRPLPGDDSFYPPDLYRHIHLIDLPVIDEEERPLAKHYDIVRDGNGLVVDAGGHLCRIPLPRTTREAIVLGMMAGHALGFRRAIRTGTALLRSLFAHEHAAAIENRWRYAELPECDRHFLQDVVGAESEPDYLPPDPVAFEDLVDRPADGEGLAFIDPAKNAP